MYSRNITVFLFLHYLTEPGGKGSWESCPWHYWVTLPLLSVLFFSRFLKHISIVYIIQPQNLNKPANQTFLFPWCHLPSTRLYQGASLNHLPFLCCRKRSQYNHPLWTQSTACLKHMLRKTWRHSFHWVWSETHFHLFSNFMSLFWMKLTHCPKKPMRNQVILGKFKDKWALTEKKLQ